MQLFTIGSHPLADHMAVLFPFEEKIYQKENISVTFVGHPLVNLVKPTMTKELAYANFR